MSGAAAGVMPTSTISRSQVRSSLQESPCSRRGRFEFRFPVGTGKPSHAVHDKKNHLLPLSVARFFSMSILFISIATFGESLSQMDRFVSSARFFLQKPLHFMLSFSSAVHPLIFKSRGHQGEVFRKSPGYAIVSGA